MLAPKKDISGVRMGACGVQVAKKGPKNKVCGCAARGGCPGSLGCAPRGGLWGSPNRVAAVVRFLGLLGAPFVGP